MSRNRARKHIISEFHLDYLKYLPLVGMLIVFIWTMSIHKAREDTRFLARQERLLAQKYPRATMITYKVDYDDSIESVASQFDISVDSIRWANNFAPKEELTPDEVINIPPVTGIVHTVERDETVESIAKKYKVDPKNIYRFPYNTFTDDRAFPILPGQILVVPEGVK